MIYRISLTFGPAPGTKPRQRRIEDEDFDATFRWDRKASFFGKREQTAAEPCVRCGVVM